ncbi:MAG: molecular chaperone TorD family protein [Sandaracinaceae bacterium]
MARSRAYSLLARLVGATPQSARALAAASADPGMRAAIASYADPDQLAADHQHVLGFSCPPFESAMLDPDGQLGRETSDALQRTLAATGVVSGPGGEEPDHLATQLYALALLAGAEADALEDGELTIASGLRERARHLLDAHLLRWLPAYASAVRRADRPWPSALLHTTLEVVLEHRSGLGPIDDDDAAFVLAPLALSLDEDATGLDDIARVLARPARAGALLSRDDAARLGRASATPRGFGDRATLFENLLRAGAQLGSLEHVVDSLISLLRSTQAELSDERVRDIPPCLRDPWRTRVDETCALLTRLRDASRGAG